jgi:hypothetical protein
MAAKISIKCGEKILALSKFRNNFGNLASLPHPTLSKGEGKKKVRNVKKSSLLEMI